MNDLAGRGQPVRRRVLVIDTHLEAVQNIENLTSYMPGAQRLTHGPLSVKNSR